MATLAQLVAIISTEEAIDVERVNALARAIREAGLVRTFGRGRSATQMDERDVANLLIGINVADTARTAPAAVAEYRALRAKRNQRASEAGSEFGTEFEELIWSARRKCLANYVMKTVSLFGSRNHVLGRKPFPNEAYRFSIAFDNIPSILLGISIFRSSTMDFVSFKDQRQPEPKVRGDRKVTTTITDRTILAVADALRTQE
ncbi:hypothetical protein SAMN05216338_10018 [Bradyrhizobium sp. Rc2d]|uniref:hypothetical protein n=1 Tax=Bradyrhizobium sp. Rc2d TaxID=1855321 RepID=UPI0008852901|nr:hypothetical protein [Bradyrhizobium sp. Rc2d]SDG35453.1 hypothetical protein SAMN05216338_10018 [Bradyrhizobium sp. Rc2d]